jgi:hypothetical protein
MVRYHQGAGREGMSRLHDAVTEGTSLPFGPIRKRTPAEYAQLHAGIEFITPEWERDCAILMARGFGMGCDLAFLAELAGKTEYEVQQGLARVARTLATWERNASKWANKYVAIEPSAAFPDGASERDQQRERSNRRGGL